jgi:hypothetical protein
MLSETHNSDRLRADSLKACKASSMYFSSKAVMDTRILALPLGTVGYLIACAKTPFLNNAWENVIAVFSSPSIIGIIWLDEFTFNPLANKPFLNLCTLSQSFFCSAPFTQIFNATIAADANADGSADV